MGKISMKSYNILVTKLKTTLISLLQNLRKTEKEHITFEELGRVFFQLDIFKVLEFDDENKRISLWKIQNIIFFF